MDKKVKVALTGASGNMGERLFAYLLLEEHIEEIRILNHDPNGTKAILKANKKYINKVKVVACPCPDPIYELHPQNKSEIGADLARESMTF